MDEIFDLIVKLIFAVLTTVITAYVIPWLREKRLLSWVKMGVEAAEKLAQSGQILKDDKKEYVKAFLDGKGVTITPTINTFIEAAVKELDIATEEIIGQILSADPEAVDKIAEGMADVKDILTTDDNAE